MRHLPPPPGWEQQAHKTGGEIALIAPIGSYGLLEVVTPGRMNEYAYDGELAVRQDEIDERDSFWEDLMYEPEA